MNWAYKSVSSSAAETFPRAEWRQQRLRSRKRRPNGHAGNRYQQPCLEFGIGSDRRKGTRTDGGPHGPIGEFYNKWKAIECMEAGEVVIMSAGTGNPFFTTDTGSSLRGIEIEADVMLKGTRVDGIYTADPEKDPTAKKFHDITYDEVLKRGLKYGPYSYLHVQGEQPAHYCL